MIRTRIAPSPTGEDIHIGNLYTAYINWAFAKKNGGKFIVRIEDTDRTRLVEGSEQKILSTLNAYSITPDESVEVDGEYGPYRQSERLAIYKKYAEELISKNKAYYCICSRERLAEVREEMKAQKIVPKYDKYCLSRQDEVKRKIGAGAECVVRLNVPANQEVVFNDLIRGEIKINTDNLDDQILIKSDGFPTYHMAVVVDDYLMKISHVIRAEEWISSTPKHILLYQAFGWEFPIFAHLPILRNPDKSKLSKRKNPVWASWYLEQGFLPEAVLNYLALMGWSHPEEKEIFDREEFVKEFTLERVRPVGPVFDVKKLEWMNGQYIMKSQNSNLKTQILEFYREKKIDEGIVEKSVPLIKERIKKVNEYWDIAGFLFERPESFEKDLSDQKDILTSVAETLKTVESWTTENIGEAMQEVAQEKDIPFGKFFMAIRIAISGKKISPPLNDSMEILGKEECVERLMKVVNS
ncbi:MAG: glutamate--tRNA ligase [Candidatus Roizmanbacteria bacterium]|nr:glutamate--tRNA ligase [Candidatus Roizmanbacteria bacterium]